VHELTYLEIADRQGIPVGTVMSRIHAARAKVRRSLSPPALDSAAS
jgi:DNA-directed RNA polymerase specialized sigma24 family protein